jgi:hypothetical protein
LPDAGILLNNYLLNKETSVLTATDNPIYITGYGYIGKKLAQALLSRERASKYQIST